MLVLLGWVGLIGGCFAFVWFVVVSLCAMLFRFGCFLWVGVCRLVCVCDFICCCVRGVLRLILGGLCCVGVYVQIGYVCLICVGFNVWFGLVV